MDCQGELEAFRVEGRGFRFVDAEQVEALRLALVPLHQRNGCGPKTLGRPNKDARAPRVALGLGGRAVLMDSDGPQWAPNHTPQHLSSFRIQMVVRLAECYLGRTFLRKGCGFELLPSLSFTGPNPRRDLDARSRGCWNLPSCHCMALPIHHRLGSGARLPAERGFGGRRELVKGSVWGRPRTEESLEPKTTLARKAKNRFPSRAPNGRDGYRRSFPAP